MTSTLHIRKNTPSPSLSPGERRFVSAEALVRWTYHDQRADLVPASYGPGAPRSMFDLLDDVAALGWIIGGGSSSAGKVHDDAALVHDIVCAMGGEARRALMVHGFLRTRPDPRIGARHRLVPRGWETGENPVMPGVWLRWPATDYDSKRGGWFVPLVQVDKPHEVARDRAEWAAWAAGLAEIREKAGPRLTLHALSDELPPLSPWEAG